MGSRTKIDWCDSTRKKVVTKQGYVLVWKPEHPNANKGKHRGYVLEHRLVMSGFLCRPLERWEVVHHKNGNKSDNRIDNLELMTNAEHMRKHGNSMSPERKAAFVSAGYAYSQSIKKSRALVPCACGCGTMIEMHDSKGRLRMYVHGHNQIGKHWKWGETSGI